MRLWCTQQKLIFMTQVLNQSRNIEVLELEKRGLLNIGDKLENAYLGCEVLGRSAEGGRRFVAEQTLLAEAEVGEDKVSFSVEKDVLRF